MQFSVVQRFASAQTEAQLRSCFMDSASQLVDADAWGLDLLDHHLQIKESDLYGLPDTFRAHYREVGPDGDPVSQFMIQQQIPAHNLSIQTPAAWKQSNIYQYLFRRYGIEHGMVGPLLGNGRLIGGIYFMRGSGFPPFCDGDLFRLSILCLHLSARLSMLQIPALVTNLSCDCLTKRELEIVELVAHGLSNREIGIKLSISRESVKQALKRIFRKLNVSARTEMVAKLKDLTNLYKYP
ncbi:LuxR family transcriptional regulator [Scytonema tolypothrichoides VB-61278]|nr:LuxR family transcriptional regulator [Scytonema tolypothrichoides VB-61278]